MFAVAKQNAHGMQRLSARIQKLETNESRGLSGVCTFSGFIHIHDTNMRVKRDGS